MGKFNPKHKAPREGYLRWLEKEKTQPDEEKLFGLLLYREENTEHIELFADKPNRQ